MIEQLITFKTAKLAKEKGFTYKGTMLMGWTSKFYHPTTETLLSYGRHGKVDILRVGYFAPTQSLLQRWLREKYNLDVEIQGLFTNMWRVRIFKLCTSTEHPNYNPINNFFYDGRTYENSLERGLYEALKLIV